MTKTKNQKSRASRKGTSARSHSWVLALVIIIIIIAIVAVIVYLVKPHSDSPESSDSTTSQQPDTPSDSKTPDDDSTSPETPDSPENKVQQYEGEDPNDLDELTGVVISKYIENGVLTVMATINQYLHQTGTCTITLTGQNSHDSYIASSDAHADITTSYCENFEIPVSTLTSDTYDIEIKLTGDGKIGTIRDEVKL